MPMSLLPFWPVGVGLVVLVVAAVLQHRIKRVPNPFTLGAIGAAWTAALVLVESGAAPAAGGGIQASIGCTVISLVMLLPFYAVGCLPAGCIKTQMAFGAWVGCALEFGPAATACALATLAGVVVSAMGAAAAYQIHRKLKHRAVVHLSMMAETAGEPIDYEQPAFMFPIQITLAAGSIGGVIALFVFAGRVGG